ncbi:MAG: hypothetical protein AAFZ07_26955 [Actinomycetota bacterium]
MEPARPPHGSAGRDTEGEEGNETGEREHRRSVEIETVAPANDAPPAASLGGVVSESLVIEARPMSMVDVSAESGRLATSVTEFETRVFANDPETAADAGSARFPPLKLNRFRPDTAGLVDPAGPDAPPPGSPAEIGQRMFLLPGQGMDRLSS